MIEHLRGTVTAVSATHVVMDLGGFGVRCLCTPATSAAVRLDQSATLRTSLVVRADSLTLYGFADAEERDCFELVQLATGVGPKLAQAIVSVLSPAELRQAILTENLVTLCKVPGIGRKGAQKLVIELKDRVQGLTAAEKLAAPAASEAWRGQVIDGLQGLGYSLRDAEAAAEAAAPIAAADPSTPIGVLMRAALQSLARR